MSLLDLQFPGVPLQGFDPEALARLGALGAVQRSELGHSFVGPGIVKVAGRLVAVLPRPYAHKPLTPTTHAAVLRQLLGVLRRYASARDAAPRSLTEDRGELLVHGDVGDVGFLARLQAALELVDDAAAHGPVVVAERLEAPTGRTHWRRTLTRHPPAGHPHGEVLTGMVNERVRPSATHPLTLAHKETLAAVEVFLRGGPVDIDHDRRTLAVLHQHGSRLFADRPRRVVGMMQRFHAARVAVGATDVAGIGCLLATGFEWVWEAMLKTALSPLSPRVLPRGRYRSFAADSGSTKPAQKQTHAGARLRPDLVIEDAGNLFVLDAKDYAPGDHPETESITKQVLYRLMYSKLHNAASPYALPQTFNGFLFPAALDAGVAAAVRADHHLDDDLHGWGDIAGIDVDFSRVAAAYLLGSGDAQLRSAVLRLVRSCPTRRNQGTTAGQTFSGDGQQEGSPDNGEVS